MGSTMTRQEFEDFVDVLNAEKTKDVDFGTVRLRASKLKYAARVLWSLSETMCNRDFTNAEQERWNRMLRMARFNADELGVDFDLNRDPRGFTLYFKTPKTGRSNSWGGTEMGWGI